MKLLGSIVCLLCFHGAAAYNGQAAVTYADSNCGSGTSECAEFGAAHCSFDTLVLFRFMCAAFYAYESSSLRRCLSLCMAVSDSLKAGGEACWNKWVPSLVSCLTSNGWSRTSLPGPKGSVVVYQGNVIDHPTLLTDRPSADIP